MYPVRSLQEEEVAAMGEGGAARAWPTWGGGRRRERGSQARERKRIEG